MLQGCPCKFLLRSIILFFSSSYNKYPLTLMLFVLKLVTLRYQIKIFHGDWFPLNREHRTCATHRNLTPNSCFKTVNAQWTVSYWSTWNCVFNIIWSLPVFFWNWLTLKTQQRTLTATGRNLTPILNFFFSKDWYMLHETVNFKVTWLYTETENLFFLLNGSKYCSHGSWVS